jgi:2'-5' RNA ligase
MPSFEYLTEILERTKQFLSDEDWRTLNRAAIPRSGGRAAWRSATTSEFEAVALRELRPDMLMRADDQELSALWARLKQWHARAKRRRQDTSPYEQAASFVAQELRARGAGPSGELLELAKCRASLAERLEMLPDVIVVREEEVQLVKTEDGVGVRSGDEIDDYTELTLDAIDDIGIPVDPLATLVSDDKVPLYDLALVRSSKLEKSVDEPDYLTKAEAHSGAMIALMAPSSVRKALDKAGMLTDSTPDSLHVTMLYLGNADALDKRCRDKIRSQVEKVCRDHRRLKVKLSGVGRFAAGKDGVPVYAVASAVGLSQLQADLERAVGQVVDLPSEHGWVPHMTLGYNVGVNMKPVEDGTLPEFAVDSVRIQMAGEPFADCKLEGKEPTEKADWDLEPEPVEQTAVRIACSAGDKQIIYYLVSEPGTVDAHGHRITEEQIEDALHGYVANSREIKLEHSKSLRGRAVLVEAFVAPMELTEFHGERPPDGPIKKGSSIAAVHYTDTKLWKELKDIDHGISWGGYARKVSR